MSKNTMFNIIYQFISQTEIRTMKTIFYNLEIPFTLNTIIYENDKYIYQTYKKLFDDNKDINIESIKKENVIFYIILFDQLPRHFYRVD